MSESFKTMAIQRLSGLIEQFKNLNFKELTVNACATPKTILNDYSDTIEYCYKTLCERFSHLNMEDTNNLLSIQNSMETCSNYVKKVCTEIASSRKPSLKNFEPLEQWCTITKDNKLDFSPRYYLPMKDKIFIFATTATGMAAVFYGARYCRDTTILRLCKNNKVQVLTNYINTHAPSPWIIQTKIHYNNDQALRESAGLGYHEIVGILLGNGAHIHANNYEAVTNALEKNSAKTFNAIFNHLKTHSLLDEAYNNMVSEDMWAHLSDNVAMQQQYKRAQKRFMTYRTLFESTDMVDILKSVCLLGETDLAHQALNNLKTSHKNLFNIQSKQFEFEGQSLLHCAAEQNNPDIIKLLFKFGHDANTKNADGVTPLELAQKRGNQEAVDALLTCSTLNFDNNQELHDRCNVKKLLEQIPVTTGSSTLAKKIDRIKYLCTLVQHTHDMQPLLDKLTTLDSKKIKNKQSLKGLPVNTIVSFIATDDLPKKLPLKMDGE